ncbi:hypothetical protein PF010_g20404 [Phytophthora fragariae]|uniref:Uncharacterized protein n=1 Tax=Phytophthora fragariae TaxID=53985 RepID=A0A6A3X9A4_9STRA|nr:hypothetical protein PF010_g20404 [Phytophthora fragariae]KAE9198610.1 hypothetical protein PF002_g22395 [Phytophthora fragariae]
MLKTVRKTKVTNQARRSSLRRINGARQRSEAPTLTWGTSFPRQTSVLVALKVLATWKSLEVLAALEVLGARGTQEVLAALAFLAALEVLVAWKTQEPLGVLAALESGDVRPRAAVAA